MKVNDLIIHHGEIEDGNGSRSSLFNFSVVCSLRRGTVAFGVNILRDDDLGVGRSQPFRMVNSIPSDVVISTKLKILIGLRNELKS